MASLDALTLLAAVAVFGTTIFTADANDLDVVVGAGFQFRCGEGGTKGYWHFNGNPIGQAEPTSIYRGTATESLDGIFNCTNREGTVSYSSARLRVFGLVGVSPSPSNCSSPDNTSSVCTVNGARSSVTLCADFKNYPEHAKRYAEFNLTIWKQVVPYPIDYIFFCNNKDCTRSRTGYSITGDWGRCLHVESVERNTLFQYVMKEVYPFYSGGDRVSRSALFTVDAVNCGDPGTPTRGRRTLSSTYYNSVVGYSCDVAYRLQGSSRRTCQSNGQWSGSLPQCNLVDCGDPGTPTNGQRTLSGTAYNAGVYYTCNEGYTLQGPQNRTCWSTGLWSERLPVCTGAGGDTMKVTGHLMWLAVLAAVLKEQFLF